MAQLPLVLIYHDPLLSHFLGVASHLFHYGVVPIGSMHGIFTYKSVDPTRL